MQTADAFAMKREIVLTAVQNSNCSVLNHLHKTADQALQTHSRQVWVSTSTVNSSTSKEL